MKTPDAVRVAISNRLDWLAAHYVSSICGADYHLGNAIRGMETKREQEVKAAIEYVAEAKATLKQAKEIVQWIESQNSDKENES